LASSPETTTQRLGRWANLRAALLAQPAAHGVSVVPLQLLLIVLSHAAMSVAVVIGAEGSLTDLLPSAADAKDVVLILLAMLGVEGVLVYIPYRAVTRRRRWFSLTHFVRLWCRTCLGLTVTFLVGAIALRGVPGLGEAALLLPIPCLIAAPAWLAYRELHPRKRMARWRPVCPECGYSLRRLTCDRCPECGEAFPTPSRVYRRWAWRRLPWERRARGSALSAYLRTTLLVIFRPAHAARGVAIPDRYGKAVRWAAVHLLLIALVGSLGNSQTGLPGRVLTRLATFPLTDFFATVAPSPSNIGIWAAQSLLAWIVALGSLPLLGAVLGIAVPGRHPAARRGIVKWSLYSFAGVSVALGLLILTSLLTWVAWLLAETGVIHANVGPWSRFVLRPVNLPWLAIWAVLYGVWWAKGVAGNPYLRRRGGTVFLAHALTYIVAWLVLTKLLFAPGALRGLL
jgi:hypothetical protein